MTQVIKLSSPEAQEFWKIPVLHEDDHLLALDKPSGLLSAPDRSDPDRPNLMKLVHAAIAERKPWVRERSLTYLMSVYRLDCEASGILLLAQTKEAVLKFADM